MVSVKYLWILFERVSYRSKKRLLQQSWLDFQLIYKATLFFKRTLMLSSIIRTIIICIIALNSIIKKGIT